MTVLFADAVNYTVMSEKLDPEEVHQIMDGCFRILIEVLLQKIFMGQRNRSDTKFMQHQKIDFR